MSFFNFSQQKKEHFKNKNDINEFIQKILQFKIKMNYRKKLLSEPLGEFMIFS